MSTPLTAEQYSELIRMLEDLRTWADGTTIPWSVAGEYSAFAYVYLTQWFGKLTIPDNAHFKAACGYMIAKLCEERCR